MAQFFVDTAKLSERNARGEEICVKISGDIDNLDESMTLLINELRDDGDALHAEKLEELLADLKTVIKNITDVTGYDRNAVCQYESQDAVIADLIAGIRIS